MLLEAVAALLMRQPPGQLCSSSTGLWGSHTQQGDRYTGWYKGGGENLGQKCQKGSAPNPLERDRWEEQPN